MHWLTTVNRTYNKGTLKKCRDLGWWGRGEDNVEKVGRTSGKTLATHLLKPETEQQES